jgi:hypothetical protein
MPGLLNNATNITQANLDFLSNSSTGSVPEFFIRVNHGVFEGYFFFVLLWVTWIILFMIAQQLKDQPINNAMYSGGIITILAFLGRGITTVIGGVRYGLITDKQLWIFPLITLLCVLIAWGTKEN